MFCNEAYNKILAVVFPLPRTLRLRVLSSHSDICYSKQTLTHSPAILAMLLTLTLLFLLVMSCNAQNVSGKSIGTIKEKGLALLRFYFDDNTYLESVEDYFNIVYSILFYYSWCSCSIQNGSFCCLYFMDCKYYILIDKSIL